MSIYLSLLVFSRREIEYFYARRLNITMISDLKQEAYTNNEQLISKVGVNNVEIIREWLSKQPHLPKISGTCSL